MTNLWERLIHLYGHKWSSTYGDCAVTDGELTDVAKTWASGLHGITGENIAGGLRRCCDRPDAWPPTLPEFKALCLDLGVNEFGMNYIPECYRERDQGRLLSSTTRDEARAIAKEKIKGLRDVLNKTKEDK